MQITKSLSIISSLAFSLSLMVSSISLQSTAVAQSNSSGNPPTIANNPQSSRPKIQIAILLDSSNSMDGLIEQTRTQIWKIVNVLSRVTKNGKTPVLEVSLYHYGNDTLSSEEGFNRLLSDFTPELDIVSERLFSIKTNGGQEYAGWVIESAINQLQWSNKKEDFRVIFIAGNEPFNQGNIDWQKAVKLAINQDVLVNTIYCENPENQDSVLWAQGAIQGKGRYFNINQNRSIAVIPTPYDQEIIEWNNKLNQTYIPYGREGNIGQQRQLTEDSNSGGNLVLRGTSKSSSYYRNSSWDLVDAVTDNIVDLATLDNAMLPENMQSMTLAQKIQYIADIKAERASIQKKIAELSQQRTEYVQKQTSTQEPKDTLDYVMIQALREQLAAKGFTLN